VTFRAQEGAPREGRCTPLLLGCRVLLNLMLKNLSFVAVSILSTVATSAATLPTPTMPDSSKNIEIAILNEQSKNQETATKEVVPEKPKSKRLVCKGCNSNEEKTLEFLQSRGITDKNALATIMGNIRQESTFHPNICEGGARMSLPELVGVEGMESNSMDQCPTILWTRKTRCSYWSKSIIT
jgi:hypothetical protein